MSEPTAGKNFVIELHEKRTENYGRVFVDEVHYTGREWWVELVGLGPADAPAFARESTETRKWFSDGPTLMLAKRDAVDVIAVGTTDTTDVEATP
jgi:hypothetical protein